MGNGYGVCSNLASSGEPPPASHDHFNHWRQDSLFVGKGSDYLVIILGIK